MMGRFTTLSVRRVEKPAQHFTMLPVCPFWLAVWAIATLGIAWFIGITKAERSSLTETILRCSHERYAGA
jgi:hypothetical protein